LTGKVEVLLTRQVGDDAWEALVRPGRKMRLRERVLFGGGELEAEITARGDFGLRTLRFVSHDSRTVNEHSERLGHVPLPPYIERADETADRERYQTVFANRPGAIAAPTAAVPFSEDILQRIREAGAEPVQPEPNRRPGTCQPVHGETLESHVMHSETYEIPG